MKIFCFRLLFLMELKLDSTSENWDYKKNIDEIMLVS